LITSLLDDDELKKNKSAQLYLTSMMNATSDLNILSLGGSMIDGNPVAVFSYMTRTIGALGDAVVQGAGGDTDKVAETLFKTTGIGKSILTTFTDPPKEKSKEKTN